MKEEEEKPITFIFLKDEKLHGWLLIDRFPCLHLDNRVCKEEFHRVEAEALAEFFDRLRIPYLLSTAKTLDDAWESLEKAQQTAAQSVLQIVES